MGQDGEVKDKHFVSGYKGMSTVRRGFTPGTELKQRVQGYLGVKKHDVVSTG